MSSGTRSSCHWAMRRFITLPIVVSMLATSASLADEPKPAADALESRHIASQSGYLPDARLPDKPQLLWSVQPPTYTVQRGDEEKLVKPSTSDGTVRDGVVYFGDDRGVLRACRVADGTEVWRHEHGERIYWTPAVDADRVYFSAEGLVAVSRETGGVLWKYDVPCSVPVVADGMVFAGGMDGDIHALDAKTGAVKWLHDIMHDAPPDPEGFDGERARFRDQPVRPTRATTDGRTLFQSIFDQCRVVAVDCKSGERRWAFQTAGWVFAQPTATEEHLYIGSQDKCLYCVEKATGKQVWKFETGSRVESAASVHGDAVCFASCDGHLYRLDRRTGKQAWKFRTDPDYTGRRFIYSKPIITDDAVYFAAGEGQLYAVDLATGKPRWKHRPFPASQMYSSPATDGRRLFVNIRPNWDDEGIAAFVAIGQAGGE